MDEHPEVWRVARSMLLGLLALTLSTCGSAETTDAEPSVPLKTLADRRGLRFGAMYQYVFRGGLYDQIFETEMSAMTAGMFWVDGSRPSRTEYDFSEMDAKVDWARARGMELHGHILVWFSENPAWVGATPVAEVEAVMNEHIDAVVGRYKGRIKVWDVVNEAVDEDGTLRVNHVWTNGMGTDYIRRAFVRAHAADPTAVLRYNEYSMESNAAKYAGAKALLINLKNQGAPVHAVGWQLHLQPSGFDASTMLARMNEIADLGFDNYVTELDVELPTNAGEADYQQQKQTYEMAVKTVLASRRLKSIVIWGLRDGDPDWLTNGHPLLFNESLQKKPAYFGVWEALGGP